MTKGYKFIDERDNSIHVVDSVDVYETVTLYYTKGKKYIPEQYVREYDIDDIVNDKEITDLLKKREIERLETSFLNIINRKF